MSYKLKYFHNREAAEQIHQYLINLPNVECDNTAKGPTIGYKVTSHMYKFATLHGLSAYQSLVLHVNPGIRNTSLGKDMQRKIQASLSFDISKIRTHVLKTNEVYIPLEKLDSIDPLADIKTLINYAYHKH